MRSSGLLLSAFGLVLVACGARSTLEVGQGGGGSGGDGNAGGDGAQGGGGQGGIAGQGGVAGEGGVGGDGGRGGEGGVGGFCGDGVQDEDEACDDGNGDNTDACVDGCQEAVCGDGFVFQGVEACDDGNDIDDDACTNDCALPTCGNGVLDLGEQCDDANRSNNDACLNTCLNATCGDGFEWFGQEPCDDGNLSNNDSCLVGCIDAACGDGFEWFGQEECDDGNLSNTDDCLVGCIDAGCGDGFEWVGQEACDDGNGIDNDACTNACEDAVCGDGFEWFGQEECDDGNPSNNDACTTECNDAFCGDGFQWFGQEQCDDGNNQNGDGCQSTCVLPICGDGIQDPGEDCDLGPGNEDRPALGFFQGNGLTVPVVPVDLPTSAPIFYNFFSASAHTGFEERDTLKVYFYRDITTEQLSLIMHAGIDLTTTGIPQGGTTLNMDWAGVPAQAFVALADDNGPEFFKPNPFALRCDWTFANNTDGGVLTNLPFPGDWTIATTNVQLFGAVDEWRFLDGAAEVPLSFDQSLSLVANSTPSACRTDCQIPACGDGFVDGGEVCDDGNNQDGDGCAGDCSSLF